MMVLHTGCLFRPHALTATPPATHLYTAMETDKTREFIRLEQEQEDDKQLALEIVATARITAPRLAKMSSISDQRSRWVTYMVSQRLVSSLKRTMRIGALWWS